MKQWYNLEITIKLREASDEEEENEESKLADGIMTAMVASDWDGSKHCKKDICVYHPSTKLQRGEYTLDMSRVKRFDRTRKCPEPIIEVVWIDLEHWNTFNAITNISTSSGKWVAGHSEMVATASCMIYQHLANIGARLNCYGNDVCLVTPQTMPNYFRKILKTYYMSREAMLALKVETSFNDLLPKKQASYIREVGRNCLGMFMSAVSESAIDKQRTEQFLGTSMENMHFECGAEPTVRYCVTVHGTGDDNLLRTCRRDVLNPLFYGPMLKHLYSGLYGEDGFDYHPLQRISGGTIFKPANAMLLIIGGTTDENHPFQFPSLDIQCAAYLDVNETTGEFIQFREDLSWVIDNRSMYDLLKSSLNFMFDVGAFSNEDIFKRHVIGSIHEKLIVFITHEGDVFLVNSLVPHGNLIHMKGFIHDFLSADSMRVQMTQILIHLLVYNGYNIDGLITSLDNDDSDAESTISSLNFNSDIGADDELDWDQTI